jgi:anti-sigma factor RsiW
MKHCDTPTLSRYLDGELSLSKQRAVEEHLDHCPECTRGLDELRTVDAVVMRWSKRREILPLQTEMRILEAVERRRLKPVRAFSRLLPAALGSSIAALLIAVSANVGWLYGNAAHNSPRTVTRSVQTSYPKYMDSYVNASLIAAFFDQRPAQSPTLATKVTAMNNVD